MTNALNPTVPNATAPNATVPAGWYPDPWGATAPRWWDGDSWTENLNQEGQSDAPAAAPSAYRSAPAPTAASDSEYPTRRARRQLTESPASISNVESDERAHGEPASASATDVASAGSASPLPPLTQTPEFSPEPVSALPPPVWTDPEPPARAEPDPVAAPAMAAPVMAAPVFTPATATTESAAPVSSAPTPVSDDADDWAASLSRWDDTEVPAAPPETAPIFGDARPVSYSQPAMRYQPTHGRTSAVWLIVLMPLLQAVAAVGSLYLFPDVLKFSDQFTALVPTTDSLAALQSWTLFAAAPIGIAFFLFTFIMGFQDRARLRLLGHDRAASPWWIVLHPFIYLIVRSVRVRQSTGRKGSAPLTVYLCLYIAPPIALAVATAVITALDGAIPI